MSVSVAAVSTFGAQFFCNLTHPFSGVVTPVTLLATAANRWAAAGVKVSAVTRSDDNSMTLYYSVFNGSTQILTYLNPRLPDVLPGGAGAKLFLGTRGGQEILLGTDTAAFNAEVWPGACWSPVACIFDGAGDGWAIRYFDDSLSPVTLGGNASCNLLSPDLRHVLRLEPGKSQSFKVVFQKLSGLPDAALLSYRQTVLAPFMARLGYAESAALGLPAAKPLGFVETSYGLQQNLDKTFADNVLQFSGMVQWSSPDGHGDNEPYPPSTQSWWAELVAGAGNTLNRHGLVLGFAMNPAAGPRFFDVLGGGFPHLLAGIPTAVSPLDSASADGWDFLSQFAEAAGAGKTQATLAYWDTGALPMGGMSGYQILRVLQLFKGKAIAVFMEAGNGDVGAWVSGISGAFWQEGAFDPRTFDPAIQTNRALKVVTPNAACLWREHHNPSVTPAIQAALVANGYIPLLDVPAAFV